MATAKRLDEKRVKEIRDFQRGSKLNRRCFDCNDMGPQYLCLDFNTFICTACSGIHREFGHRVKSISMSTFSDTEVQNLTKFGGNEAAKKFWLANYDQDGNPIPDSRKRDQVRRFIQKTYIDRSWVYDNSPVASPRKVEKPTRKKKTSKKEIKKADADDEWDAFTSERNAKKTGNAESNDFNPFDLQGTQGPQKEFGDFTNFADFSNFNEAKNISSTANDEFGSFATFESTPSSSNNQPSASVKNDMFGDFMDSPVAMTPASPSLNLFDVPTGLKSDSLHISNSNVDAVDQSQDPFAAFASSNENSSSFDLMASQPLSTSSNISNPFISTTPSTTAQAHQPFGDIESKKTNVSQGESMTSDPFSAFDNLDLSKSSNSQLPSGASNEEPTGFSAFDNIQGKQDVFDLSAPSPSAGDSTISLGMQSNPQQLPHSNDNSQYQQMNPHQSMNTMHGMNFLHSQGVNSNMVHNNIHPTQNMQVHGMPHNHSVQTGFQHQYGNNQATYGYMQDQQRMPMPPTPQQFHQNTYSQQGQMPVASSNDQASFQQIKDPASSIADPFASLNIGDKFGFEPSKNKESKAVPQMEPQQYIPNNGFSGYSGMQSGMQQPTQVTSGNPFDMF